MNVKLLALLLLPALSLPLGAAEPGQAIEDIQRGIACHERAVTVPETISKRGRRFCIHTLTGIPWRRGTTAVF